MFEAFATPARKRPQLRQLLFPFCFAAGSLLNLVASLNRPAHMHHGVWFWLSLVALACMTIGIACNLRDRFAGRRTNGVRQIP